MTKITNRAAILCAATAMAATALVAVPTAANASCVSSRGYVYSLDLTKPHGLVLDGFGTPKIVRNASSGNVVLTLTQTSAGTAQWSVNGSTTTTSSYDFAVVRASVATAVGGSYTPANAESLTATATLTVPSKGYAILQGGVMRRVTTGHYYFDNGNCTYTTGSIITTKLPLTVDTWESTWNLTGTVPWDQNNKG